MDKYESLDSCSNNFVFLALREEEWPTIFSGSFSYDLFNVDDHNFKIDSRPRLQPSFQDL
jgi:hypothetical protein